MTDTGWVADLLSDTVTRPTAPMRRAMAEAEVGDDVFGEDPTVRALEERVAGLLGHEAGLFAPTGSLTNQLGLRLHVDPGGEMLADALAHVVRAELGAAAVFSGITSRTWSSTAGRLVAKDALAMVTTGVGPYQVETQLVVVENTHNFGGGTIQPLTEIRALRDGLAGTDLSLVMLMGGTEAEDRRTVSYIGAGHVDGLIHLNPYLDDPVTLGLAASQLPLVLCGARPPHQLPARNWSVTVDDAGGTVQAMNHLAERGAKRIALVGGEPRAMGAAARAQAYLSWHGAGFEPTLVEHGDFGYESGRTATERLLAREPGIDAIFAASDRMALGAIEAARGIGRRVPEDLLVIGFDDQRSAATSDPPLSTIRQPIRAIGRAAVGALLAALADQTPSDLTFPTELVVRSST